MPPSAKRNTKVPEKEASLDQPTPDSQQTLDQVHDSGINNNELPVEQSDKTSSPRANESTDTEQLVSKNKLNIGKKIAIAAFAVAAGTALVVGAVFGSKAGDTPKNAPPQKSPTKASQSPQPTATEVIPESPNYAELIAAQEIKSGQTKEALAIDINDKFNNWEMAGTDTFQDDYKAEALKTGDGSDATRTKFAHDYAMKQFTNIFGPALYGLKAGDAVDPQLQASVDKIISINSSNLELHWVTSAEPTPYVRGNNLDPVAPVRVESQNSDMITLSINYSEFDNSNLNTAAAIYTSYGIAPPSGIPETIRVTLKNTGGFEKITAYISNFR